MSKHRTRGTKWNRLLSGVLCLALMLGLLPSAGLIQTAEAAHWADPYGEQLVEWGVMNPSKDLRLGSTITRAEFVAMCNRAFGYKKLGSIPFVDVPSSAWYAEDINVAYNAGYFQGTSDTTASPNGTLTREQAAVLVVRNLMLQETVGEVQGFTDSHDLHEWSRGLIGAAVAEGMIGGYEDGSYRPTRSITRGEVAKMLVSIIGTPISKAGSYELGSVYGNVVISSSNVSLRNTTIAGNLYVTGGVDLGNILLENVTVLGRIVVAGGGESHAGQSSVVLRNVTADELLVDSMIDQFITVSAYGITDIPVTHVRSDAFLEDASSPGYGLKYIELDGDPGTLLQLAGTIKEVVNKTPFSTLQLAQGTAEKITIDEYARDSELILDINTRVNELNLDVATHVYGKGDITDLTIGASDCDVEILPEHVTIRPGIVATVAGEVVDSNGASELSEEPRLLAGYPAVKNITPTTAEGQFSGNKPGTIYYAVSELADGSVSEEDLVNNPAYGGIIFQGQAGTIASSAKTVYSRAIAQLEPDGSYYLTAMLEDGRGNRSPIKVISFTTPDNTVPEFLNGRISLETCDVVQLTGMPNKSCMLYWVLLPDGAAAPTAQNFKSGTFGGNYGRGSMSVTKNVPVSITVNTSRLQEKTDYDLYVWLNDFDGVQSSQVYKYDVHTPDETPPVVTAPEQTGYGATTADVTFSMNEAGTFYWAVVPEGNVTFISPGATAEETLQILSSLRTKIKVESGRNAGALVSGSVAVTDATANTNIQFTISGLDPNIHSYTMYYVAKDTAGNYSDQVRSITIRTPDSDSPTVTLEFSSALGSVEVGKPPQPYADTDLRLIFSEQVKGGMSATKTFVDYYNDVENAAEGPTKDAAKAILAEVLSEHIELRYVGEDDDIALTTDKSKPYGWVNWGEAVVKLQSDGTVVLTLKNALAVELGSGMSYYFHFYDVFDDSINPNRLQNTSNDYFDLKPNFTTVYGQVTLRRNTSVVSVDDMVPSIGSGEDYTDWRLDMCVEAVPKSTGNVSDDDCWDMIIWSDTSVAIVIFRRIDGGPWEKMTDNPIEVLAGLPFSLNYVKNDSYVAQPDDDPYFHKRYETVAEGLQEGLTYQYGIHFVRIGTEESDPTEDPQAWSALVTMDFSVIAGNETYIRAVSGSVNANYNAYVRDGNINEIGSVKTDEGTATILTYPKQFSDTRPPAFADNYPTLSAGSGSVNMNVALDRRGTVYYVVAPVEGTGRILTTFKNDNGETITVGPDNDGREYDNITSVADKKAALSALGDRTYIPRNGTERANYAEFIHYMTGGNGRKYAAPLYSLIYDYGNRRFTTEFVKSDKVVVDTPMSEEKVTVTGLQPLTWYYVYVVLQSESDTFDGIVQVYRVRTTDVEPPAISVVRGSTTAEVSMTCYDVEATSSENELYNDPMMYYVLARKDRMPAWFSSPSYSWGGRSMTILNAMIEKVGGTARSYFDVYADQVSEQIGEDLKNKVLGYITRSTEDTEFNDTTFYFKSAGENPKTEPCDNYLKSGGEYVMLVCARHRSKTDTDGANYGFAATGGLFMPDNVPPEFIGNTGKIRGSFTGVYITNDKNNKDYNTNYSDNPNWPSWKGMERYYFSGTLTLSFSKAIYTYRNGILKQIIGGSGETGTTVGILNLINSSGKITGATMSADGTSFTVTYERLQDGEGITLTGLYNASSTPSAIDPTSKDPVFKVLKITLNTYLTTQDYYPNDKIEKPVGIPGFEISWG